MFDPNLLKTPTRAPLPFFPPTPPSSSLSPDSPGWSSLWTEKVLDLASPRTPERSSLLSGHPLHSAHLTPAAACALAGNDSGKRGRPRADVISHLILEGSSSPSGIKCRVCSRVFPREKSLQAHLRTHTGERPYNCDYPGCNRAFTQSGQLKTHQRLHAGEKPFICSSPGCSNRYTHANRTCPLHPHNKPSRSSDLVLQPVLSGSENSDAVLLWLDNYRRDREEKTPGKSVSLQTQHTTSPPLATTTACEENTEGELKRATKRGLELDIENVAAVECVRLNQSGAHNSSSIYSSSPLAPHHNILSPKKSILEERLGSPRRKTLGDITASNHLNTPPTALALSNVTANSSFKLKKRWLKEAFLEIEQKEEEERRTEAPEELALPIRWAPEDELPQRRSPKSLVVANALVELSSSLLSNNSEQPLNLSLNSSADS